jgi:hypothetical protein
MVLWCTNVVYVKQGSYSTAVHHGLTGTIHSRIQRAEAVIESVSNEGINPASRHGSLEFPSRRQQRI